MSKAGSLDENIFGDTVVVEGAKKATTGRQEDGTYITSTGKVLPAKNRNRRVPYPEPEEAQVDGFERVVQTPNGSVAFNAKRMNDVEFRAAGFPERKRQKLRYAVQEVYAGQPRRHYSWDELEQLERAEIKR